MIVAMKLDLPTEPAMVPVVRRQVDALLRHMSVTEDDLYRAGILVTEACSNVVRHAYEGPGNRYSVQIEYHAHKLVLEITDSGRGFDADSVPTPVLGQIGGYGLYFIRQAADRVELASDPVKGTKLLAEIDVHYRGDTALCEAVALDK